MLSRFSIPAILLSLVSTPEPGGFCSLLEIGIGRGGKGISFTLTASEDTIAVPRWVSFPGPRPSDASTHGQIVRITRLVDDAPPELRDALRASGDLAVLVPWSTGPDCRETGWGQASYRWITSPIPAFLDAALRPRSAWANGVPTFDVSVAYHEPFPHVAWLGARRFRGPPEDRQQMLSADEYFEMYTSLPTFEEWKHAPEASLERIRTWVREHPETAKRYPASTLLEEAAEWMRGGPFGAAPGPSPLAGARP